VGKKNLVIWLVLLIAYLVGLFARSLGDDRAVEHDVLQLVERAQRVEQQLGAVPAPQDHHRVPPLRAVHDHDLALLAGLGPRRHRHRPASACAGASPRTRPCRRRPPWRRDPVALHHVGEELLHLGQPARVADGEPRGLVGDLDDRGGAPVVRPHLGLNDVAALGGEHVDGHL
jgi:hypothetical protein